MARFLHTADWQLGLKHRRIDGDRGARLRNERFEAVRRIAALAVEREVEAVVVAGDVFDDNAVGGSTLQQARDALAEFGSIPVLLLPGNHDAATPESALRRLAPELHGLAHVRLLLDPEPVELGDLVFYPCPLTRRHSRDDPTRELPARRSDERTLRVAVAHGGVLDFGESTECPNLIDAAAVAAKGFDYLALGDWHGTFRFGARAWYPGTPEPTRFEESDPGKVLLVELESAGAEPRVEPLPVARSRWLRLSEHVDGAGALAELEQRLRELPERSWTLIKLELEGELSLAERARLDRALEAAREELLHLRLDDRRVLTRPSEADLEALAVEGFVGRAAAALRESPEPAAEGALRLLYRLLEDES